ncbi:phosphotransferase [Streptomyces microflavus]|uniref:protein kinase domain-containing protein n=1 Tax=Streptomyces TaxID=1883 RepID=UPI000BEFEBB5|nr:MULTISPECIES: phosphotransferase [unclassified Streptomyces]
MHPLIGELGLNTGEPQLLHDRRDTTLFKVGDTALKITQGLMAGREGEILALLSANHYLAHGPHGDGTWLTTRWLDGPSLWRALESASRGDDSAATRRIVLARAAGAAYALARLHAAGWSHGDIQPDHIIFEGQGVQLIDLACAQGPAPVPFYVHRGGLSHITSPEVAAQIIASEEHIVLTREADIWALGASLFWAWTQRTPTNYRAPEADLADRLADIAAGRLRTIESSRPWAFPAFEQVLRVCLAEDPRQRPSAAELAALLVTASSTFGSSLDH